MSKPTWPYTLLFWASAIFLGLMVAIILLGGRANFGIQPDTRRISDLQQVTGALELYREKSGHYPIFIGEENWPNLTKTLISAQIGVTRLPQDPVSPRKTYEYSSSPDGQHYVLRAILDDRENLQLKESARGIIFGINCGSKTALDGKGEYCITY